MAAVVDVWVGELAKLGEKVKIKKSLLLKIRRSGEASESKVRKLEEEEHTILKVQAKNDNTLSESTLFMLMDSFAPS